MTALDLQDLTAAFVSWLNANQGVLSVVLFIATIIIAWVSGIFTSLRRKPKFKLGLIPGPTFSCTFHTGKKFGEYDQHRTAIALYLNIANVGSASASVENVAIAYRWHVRPRWPWPPLKDVWLWVRYRIFWFWLHHQAVTLTNFQVAIGENIKFYPSLFQPNTITGTKPETFLEIGRSVNGVVYFEQDESWGGCFPSPRRGHAHIKVAVMDSFGTTHIGKFWVPIVDLDAAKKYNPSFGETLPALRSNPAAAEFERASIK
jgi:hypothetical protein